MIFPTVQVLQNQILTVWILLEKKNNIFWTPQNEYKKSKSNIFIEKENVSYYLQKIRYNFV